MGHPDDVLDLDLLDDDIDLGDEEEDTDDDGDEGRWPHYQFDDPSNPLTPTTT